MGLCWGNSNQIKPRICWNIGPKRLIPQEKLWPDTLWILCCSLSHPPPESLYPRQLFSIGTILDAVKWIFNLAILIGCLVGWRLRWYEFDFYVVHRAEIKNQGAYALSRLEQKERTGHCSRTVFRSWCCQYSKTLTSTTTNKGSPAGIYCLCKCWVVTVGQLQKNLT